MAKQSEKVAADKQPESQRGKSRFGTQPRSNRVVLPDRPPREIDNEIVSILLGGDPTSLAAQASEEQTSTAATVPPHLAGAETAPLREATRREEKPEISEPAGIIREMETLSAPVKEVRQPRASDSSPKTSPISEVTAEKLPVKAQSPSPTLRERISVRESSLPASGVDENSSAAAQNIQDSAISTFEEFAERWKHGLRKGQLKVCEALYQKTYALGETQCVTSFSELGRLSGLKMRQCFNIIAQLEALKFVERAKSGTTSNKKDQGSIISFYLFPKS
jgi:hypothetical protein